MQWHIQPNTIVFAGSYSSEEVHSLGKGKEQSIYYGTSKNTILLNVSEPQFCFSLNCEEKERESKEK